MSRMINKDDLDRAKTRVKQRGKIRKVWFSDREPTKVLRFVQPTFTMVLKDEEELDGTKFEYSQQFQIKVMSVMGGGKEYLNILGLWPDEFVKIAEAIESAGGDHLNLEGKTFEITYNKNDDVATAKLVTEEELKPRPATNANMGATVYVDDADLFEMAVDTFKPGWEPFQLRLWLQERLENEGLVATNEQLQSVCDKICASAPPKKEKTE